MKYKFTVVIPVYNVEKFLEETILSVINQTIGFEKNIQMILVNDGSPDNSEEICLKYKELYPHNTKYIKQENKGVSEARNAAYPYVEGEYVNFLDSDDVWQLDSFQAVYKFFKQYEDEIDLVACPMEFFEAKTGLHPLSWKFEHNKIVDIRFNYDYLHLHITSIFIKKDILKNYFFDKRLNYGEDAFYTNTIILEKQKYGLVAEAKLFYRKRADGSSAVQGQSKSKEWYMRTPQIYYKGLIDLSIKNTGEVLLYIQYLFIYEMKNRIVQNMDGILSENERTEYIETCRNVLIHCEDDIICGHPGTNIEQRYFMLCLKYGRDIKNELVCRNSKLYFNNCFMLNLDTTNFLKVIIVDINEDRLVLEGEIWTPLKAMIEVWIEDINGKKYPIITSKKGYRKARFMDFEIMHNYEYRLELPLTDKNVYRACGLYREKNIFTPHLAKGKFVKINDDDSANSYFTKNGYNVKLYYNYLEIERAKEKKEIN